MHLQHIFLVTTAIIMIVWGYFMLKGGQVTNRQFLVFSIGMMIGQIGAGIECFMNGANGTAVLQGYFLAFTIVGLVKRFRPTKAKE